MASLIFKKSFEDLLFIVKKIFLLLTASFISLGSTRGELKLSPYIFDNLIIFTFLFCINSRDSAQIFLRL